MKVIVIMVIGLDGGQAMEREKPPLLDLRERDARYSIRRGAEGARRGPERADHDLRGRVRGDGLRP